MAPLAAHFWPAAGAWLTPQHELLIVAVRTPETPHRDQARRLVRAAISEVLGAQLGCPPADVRLVSTPGQALRLENAASRIGLSVSHEPGLSLAAIHLAGPVGVDLQRVAVEPAWLAEIPNLARDYLGPALAREIAALPAGEQASRFAEEWTVLEASLKCLGIGLQEWSPGLQQRLAGCRSHRLQVPRGYVGSVAVPARDAAA